MAARAVTLVGTALGGSLAMPVRAEKVIFNGTGDFSVTRTDTLTDTAQVVDARTTAGNLNLNFADIDVSNVSGVQGAGIYGQVANDGNISITSGTLTATGASTTFGIDARTTTGDVTITADRTTSNINPLSRGIHINSNGAISVTANETNGGQRGIFTGGVSGGFPTSVNITSVTATASGVSQPNAIVGQGNVVNIVSGTASNTSTSGVNGAAIFTNSGVSTVKSTTVNLSGLNQSGIQINADTGMSSIESGSVTGEQSASGIVVDLYGIDDTGVTVKSGAITLNGANSIGIDVASSASGLIAIDSGTITGGGIIVAPANGAATIMSNAITRGNISVEGGSGAIAVTSNSIESTSGGNAIIAQNFGGSVDDGVSVTSTTITGTGGGITASSAGAVNVDSGTIVQTATLPGPTSVNSLQGTGITVTASGLADATVKSQSIAFSGTGNTYGIAVQAVGGGAANINSGSVSVVGNGGYGILAASTTGAINIVSTGNVTTTGTTRAAGGSPAPESQRYADAIVAISNAGGISVTSGGVVTTSGATARGINVETGRARTTFGTPSADASTAAITVANNGTIFTAGASSAAIRIAADDNAVLLTSANVATTGANAAGIDISSNAGAINVTTGNVSTSGAASDAVRIVSASGPITATVNGSLSAINGTGLFIDPPSSVVINVQANGNVRGSVAGISTVGASNAITNLGTISTSGTGAALIASGATTLLNSGTINGGSGGMAVQFGATNDTVTIGTGSSVTGAISGGGGIDTATLVGTLATTTPTQTIARFTGFDSLSVASGYWTAMPTTASVFNTAAVASGASLELANAGAGLGIVTPSIVNNGNVVVRSTSAAAGSTFGNTMVSGNGNILLTGSGTVVLDGVNSLANTGTTTIGGGTNVLITGTQAGTFVTAADGTLQIGNGGTTGDFTGGVVNGGTLVAARSDDYVFDGALTGTGLIIKRGAGKLTFGNGYAFTGTTNIESGSIRLSTPVAATTELSVEGAGQIDLSGTRQTVAELKGASTEASVNIDGGLLTVNQSTNTSFAGDITGNGSLTKTGSGTLNLTGENTYTGPTAVDGGTLAVNGSIASAVTVNSGGSLGGTGRVASVVIARGGRFAPGNSIGTLTVAGPVGFASGSTFDVEINPNGRSDLIIATGPATLTGGTVNVIPEAGTFAKTTTYNILTASAVNGQFAGVTTASADLIPVLGYTATGVNLTIASRSMSFGAIATTPNQVSIAAAANALNPGNAIFNAVLVQPNAAAGQAAFDALSGEVYASMPTALLDQSRLVRGAILERSSTPDLEGVGIWGQAFDTASKGKAEIGIAQVDADRRGLVAGIDFGGDSFRVGANAGYIESDIDVRARASNANVETRLVGVYGRVNLGALSATVGGSYEWHDIVANRSIGLNGLAGGLNSAFNGTSRQVFGDLSYALTTGEINVSPFVSVANVRTKIDGFTETGTAAALTVSSQTREVTVGSVGMRMSGVVPIGDNVRALPRFSIAYRRNWGDRDATSNAAFAGAANGFTIRGTGLGRGGVDIDGGVEIGIGNAFRIGASYMMSATSAWSDRGAKVTASFAF